MIQNRYEAGLLLAKKLEKYKATNTVVIALPRGGVVIGRVIADKLLLPLDIVVTRKIGHPLNPEYAIGAVDDSGTVIFNEVEIVSVDKSWLEKEIQKQQNEAKRRVKIYRKGKKLKLQGKDIIIVDDGIATGFTMQLAVKAMKKENPNKIIVAVPVAPLESIGKIKKEGVDEIVLLKSPEEFLGAIGAHYQEFEQVEDNKVIKLLNP